MITTSLKMGLVVGMLSAVIHAGTVSLQNDFSITNGNPNGNWSYTEAAHLRPLPF